ncbi:von Willebrand factor A domain containing protein 5B1 [Dissostichus eleginoides]|uniref:von Willebrand factor A domain containing protein 5B1 n=1 Tax=Dissostichus eleginoides TaxID=100907 RepID=A0AAD9CC34_DISEL|nr:von Willebrand factor A domain containing protein 5B1 [Dissostichus eleginoides]
MDQGQSAGEVYETWIRDSLQERFMRDMDQGQSAGEVYDAMVLILKSLQPGCLFNIIGFGSTFKPLFPTSQSYEEENLVQASEYVRRLRGDMGGTNVLNPLIWILRQPSFRGHPRLLFLITDGAVRNTGAVIELIRSQARSIRCFTFGLGQTACRRLVLGLAAVSRGTAEFLSEGERLQPKKTMCPVLTDISIEWLFPETKEVLLSPVGNNFLFPGDSLIGYSVDKRRRYSMMRSVESASSVFSLSGGGSLRTGGRASCETSPRRRAYSTTQISDHHPTNRAFTPSDPCSVAPKNPLRRAKVQELVGQSEAQWRRDYQGHRTRDHQSFSSAGEPLFSVFLQGGRPAVSQRPPPDPEPQPTNQKPPSAAPNPAGGDGSRSSSDSPSVGSLGDSDGYGHQLVQAETPQEVQASDLGSADCKAVVTGLLSGRPASWEVVFDIEPFLSGREREEKVHEELWNETFHHLAGRSIIRDFENMADAESEIEHGPGRKYQLFAIHTSKSCNILSKHTAFVPIDLDTNEYLHTCIEYSNAGEGLKSGSRSSSRSGSRKNRGYSVGLGRSQSGGVSEDAEDFLINNGEDGASPCSTPSSAGWEHCSFSKVSQRSPSITSDQSQKSVESIFFARLALSRTRLLTRAAKGFMWRSHSKSGDLMGESDNENKDYIPLVLLQLASGAFPLDAALCFATSVPMEKLKWTSPFSSHRNSLAPQRDQEFSPSHDPPVRGSVDTSSPRRLDPESLIWGTAVALAWLEHSSASHFIDWELAAAKASTWLSLQEIPEGRDLESVKAAANQLFIILRHWDENLQLNMLCYHPSSV